ncbi:glutamine-rich protein 2-like isoform X4 [Colius striatus]|uniref:glutamine-rich protein 2-like isoform X4 n=1 Tax=Colius striatus TaxID=57412 RepID=UPI002B1E25BE|nr:glutamine-rich protein 2-like isoform X4 [Colius striatus]
MAILSLSQLLDRALGIPEDKGISSQLLHRVLDAMLGHLGLRDAPAEAPMEGTALGARVASLAAELQQLRERVEANESSISKAVALSQDVLTQIGGIQVAQSRMGEEIRALQENVQSAASSLRGIHDQITALTSDLERLKEVLSLYPRPDKVKDMVQWKALDDCLVGSTTRGGGGQEVESAGSRSAPAKSPALDKMQEAPVTAERRAGSPSGQTNISATSSASSSIPEHYTEAEKALRQLGQLRHLSAALQSKLDRGDLELQPGMEENAAAGMSKHIVTIPSGTPVPPGPRRHPSTTPEPEHTQQHGRRELAAEHRYPRVPRQCGGRHTVTQSLHPPQLPRLQRRAPWNTEDEVPLVGTDGRVYRGRLDAQPPAGTQGTARAHVGRDAATQPLRQQHSWDSGRLLSRPQNYVSSLCVTGTGMSPEHRLTSSHGQQTRAQRLLPELHTSLERPSTPVSEQDWAALSNLLHPSQVPSRRASRDRQRQ